MKKEIIFIDVVTLTEEELEALCNGEEDEDGETAEQG